MRQAGILAGIVGFALAVPLLALPCLADTQVRQITGGTSCVTFVDSQLAAVGLSVGEAVATADMPGLEPVAAGARRFAFAMHPEASLTVRVVDDRVVRFEGAAIPHEGSLRLISSGHVVPLTALALRAGSPREEAFGAFGSGADFPFEIRNAAAGYAPRTGELFLVGGDLVVTPEWARATGRPGIAGEWVGSFDLRASTGLVRREAVVEPSPGPAGTASVPGIDVLLREVYGMDDLGRTGTYPAGVLGLSFNTTSCNNGTINVPWHAPMAEDHPFIGLAMFRLNAGRFEQIGRSWTKHGFYALASDQCFFGCTGGSGGGTLNVGCSDTYSIANNGSQYYLGARDEVNPHTAVWHCLGSWFDGTPVDCIRSNDGSGLDGTAHRLAVRESDLLVPGATYYYEGVYWVMNDVNRQNNYGWRQVTPAWTTIGGWSFTDSGSGPNANPGPVIYAWGDEHDAKDVAAGDGTVVVANRVTNLGGGQWHYEYAVYNQSSARGIGRFTIPVGTANLTNVGFRDIDSDAGNQWTVAQAGGTVSWSTPVFGGPVAGNPVLYQSVFNFWFDADAAPLASSALVQLHAPGAGGTVYFAVHAPYAGATAVVDAGWPAAVLDLSPVEPNPFGGSARVAFTLGREGPVRLTVVDVTGRLVRTMLEGAAPRGRSTLSWNGRDDAGAEVASGIYFFRLSAAGESRTVKGVLRR